VKYYDADNVPQTWDSAKYQVDASAMRTRLAPVITEDWPETYERMQAVQVRAVVGYGNAAAVPLPIKQWMLCAISSMYEHRELVSDRAALQMSTFLDGLLDPYRIIEA
jgi:hypothetical protein